MSLKTDLEKHLEDALERAIRPEPIEQAAAAVGPIKALLRRLKEGVIPLIEQQREPSQRKALLARLEFDLRGAFKILGDLDVELRETRRSCTELHRIARKLRPRGKPRPPARRRPGRRRRPPVLPTDEQKKAVLDALQERGAVAMSELCHATGFGMAKLKRILNVLREEGSVERSGTTSATRYRSTAAPGRRRR